MIRKINILVTIVVAFITLSFTINPSSKYKCMIQMTNYSGEGAYIVVSLLDKDGNYLETLNVKGNDEDWYHDITQWWENLYGKKRPNIDAITGETLTGGERAISIIEIENDKIDTGYTIRFETAVEDQEYFAKDVEFELTAETVKSKVNGKGFIRYIRLIPQ
ncbi:MAG: flagellin biosynthesis protein FlgD [Kordia sp.]|nr:MAG: flagellin biosynthesis protein FlgD [Kordia sp.]